MIKRCLAAVAVSLLAAVSLPAGVATAEPAAPVPTVDCEFIPTPENPAAKPVQPPSPTAEDSGTVQVLFVTNYGAIVMELDRSNAPCAVHNLTHLANSLFYDETQCWRLTAYRTLGVLQCGDIIEAEVGGPGYRFADELTGDETYPRGTVAMGNLGPDTNGSQFFMVHSVANIPPDYTVLGRVVQGMATLDRIVAAGITDDVVDGTPKRPVHIDRVAVL